jgi:hypothetical protein
MNDMIERENAAARFELPDEERAELHRWFEEVNRLNDALDETRADGAIAA